MLNLYPSEAMSAEKLATVLGTTTVPVMSDGHTYLTKIKSWII